MNQNIAPEYKNISRTGISKIENYYREINYKGEY